MTLAILAPLTRETLLDGRDLLVRECPDGAGHEIDWVAFPCITGKPFCRLYPAFDVSLGSTLGNGDRAGNFLQQGRILR